MALEIINSPLYLDANMQGYWRLEANGNDSSANGYNLAGTAPTHTTGKFGNGADFESASSQYISIANASCPNLAITGSRTLSAWIKVESITASNQGIISKLGESNAYRGYVLRVSGTTGKVAIGITSLTTNTDLESDTAVAAGEWYHVCGVYDSTNSKLKIFLNGIKKEVTASGSSIDSGIPFAVGCTYAGAGDTVANLFDGIIDDAAIWNRALTDAEVTNIYAGVSLAKVMFIS